MRRAVRGRRGERPRRGRERGGRRDARGGRGPRGCLNALRAAGADVERPRESDGMTALGVHRAWVANLSVQVQRRELRRC